MARGRKPQGGRKYHQGFFKPVNPKKYVGDPKGIVFRSSWELRAMSRFDTNPDIVAWASEELIVPYYDPATKKNRRYFPDFLVRTADGKVWMVEIKPAKEMAPPKVKGRKKETVLAESATYATNSAKWAAARLFCEARGWEFKVMNEYDLGITSRRK